MRAVTPLRRGSSAFGLAVIVTAGCLAGTALVVVLPFVDFAYRAPALHVVLETVSSLVALLVCFLLYGRFRRGGGLQELLLACSLAVVAVANLLLAAIPTALALSGEEELSRWAPLVVRLVGTLLLVSAALSPAGARVRGRLAGPVVLLLALLVTGLSVLLLVLGGDLPPPVDPADVPTTSSRPVVTGHPAALAVQAVSGLLYAVAAVAFTRRSARTHDDLLRFVGAACVLSAFARVNYLLFPSLYSDYVYVGDLLRFAFYLMLLAGAGREIRSYWAAQAQAAVLEDRRRLARDLHDGLTQELTYIWSQSRLLTEQPGDLAVVERINGASARALDEARAAIAALTRTSTGSFAAVLRESVEALASRYGVQARVEAAESVELSPAQGDAVLRIVGEAFRNAVRHGGASTVAVVLSGPPLVLVVRDDGVGFEVDAGRQAGGGGFGLVSMRERAEGLGAAFGVQSELGAGTTVEVRWP